jgi:ribosomal protein S12 methylthiotransferase accessory factor
MSWTRSGEIDLADLRRRYPFARLLRPQVGMMESVTFLPQELGSPLCEIASTSLGNVKMAFPYVNEARAADLRNRTKVIGGAGGDVDPEMAWIRAVVEGAERYANLVYQPEDFVVASAEELGDEALDLDSIPRCSEREIADPRCFLERARKDQPMRWARGYSLTSRRYRMVPAVMTHLYINPWPSERYWLPISTGVAAHTSLAAALVSAICESVERDAIALTWLARLPVPRILRPDPMPAPVAALLDRIDESRLEQHFFDVTTDIGIPTILAVQVCPGHPTCELFVSCATAPDPRTAYAKTIREAIPGRNVMGLERSIPERVEDFVEITNGADYYGRGGHREDFDFLLAGNAVTTLDEMARALPANFGETSSERQLAFLVERLRSLGWEAIAVDLTTDELRDAGLWAVRVIMPQPVPVSFVHRARYLGTPRLYQYPKRFGIELTEADVNPGPMPFA